MRAMDVVPVDPIDPATTLLAAITSGLSVVREPRLVRARFEEELRTLVNARSISVRDCAADTARLPDVISFDVPSAPWTMPARLEAVFESTGAVTESQLRTLSFGAQIASLLVQIECASGGGPRLRREDGAAPLIGSSSAIHAVRERIERVAVTDFTVLIEGGFGPQPHAVFVGVFGEDALNDGDGAVAGADSLIGPPSSLHCRRIARPVCRR